MEDDSLVLGLSNCRVDIDAIVMGNPGRGVTLERDI